MNQDQVKQELLRLEPDTEEFTVIFTGKKSRKVNGLYKPDIREILLHNKNFADDNGLMYTAIHEFAHHLHFTRSPVPISCKAHQTAFWSIFHNLLIKAEEMEIYRSIFDGNKEFKALTKKIKEEFLARNGKLMKEFGALLMRAQELCAQTNTRFEDYVDRILGLHRTEARTLMKMTALDVDPSIGFANMKTVVSLRDEEDRRNAQAAFLLGKSPDMVKAEFCRKPAGQDPAEQLLQEKRRIEKTIVSLNRRLEEIDGCLTKLEGN
jgi:hypothetical protein